MSVQTFVGRTDTIVSKVGLCFVVMANVERQNARRRRAVGKKYTEIIIKIFYFFYTFVKKIVIF